MSESWVGGGLWSNGGLRYSQPFAALGMGISGGPANLDHQMIALGMGISGNPNAENHDDDDLGNQCDDIIHDCLFVAAP